MSERLSDERVRWLADGFLSAPPDEPGPFGSEIRALAAEVLALRAEVLALLTNIGALVAAGVLYEVVCDGKCSGCQGRFAGEICYQAVAAPPPATTGDTE